MAKQGAIFCAGHLRDYRKHLDSFVSHVVEPNALDVYLSVDRKSSWVERPMVGSGMPDEHDEEAYLRDRLGSRLKLLHWANEDLELDDTRRLCESLARQRLSNNMVWFVDQFVRLSYLVQLVQKQFPEEFSGYDYMVRFRIDVQVENLIPFAQLVQQSDLQPGQVWVRPDWSHSVKELFVCDPATFVRIACHFPYAYGSYVPTRIEGLPNYGVPEYQLGQFLRERQFELYQLHLEFGYRYDTDHKVCCVYVSTQPNFLTTKDPLFLTRLPTSMQVDDLERAHNSPGIQFHPAAAQCQPELFRAAEEFALGASISSRVDLTLSNAQDYVMVIVLAVLTAFLVATNLLWWWCYSEFQKGRFHSHDTKVYSILL